MEYIIKSTALMSVFMCFYWLFLQRETHFTSNRIYFLGSLLLSIILPFVVYPVYIDAPVLEQLPINLVSIPVDNIEQVVSTEVVPEPFTIDWFMVLKGIYLIGIVSLIIKFTLDVYSLFTLLRKADKKKEAHITFVQTLKKISPFSVFNYIVYNKKQFTAEELEQVILHEKVHVNQKHSVDLLLVNLMLMIQWFNPFVWLFKKQLEQNLEYIADHEVAKQTNNIKDYQYLLLKTSVKENPFALSTNFYNSFIKKRIIMLQKTPTKKKNYLKVLLLLPLLTLFLYAFNKKEIIKNSEVTPKTIVIDVSHGGKDAGAVVDHISEKEIVQSIAKKIETKYKGEAKLIFTRDKDEFKSLSKRVEEINKINPDILISLHVNASKNKVNNGVIAYIGEEETGNIQSNIYASQILQSLKSTQLESKGLMASNLKLITGVKSPSVLLELGYLTNKKDRDYLQSNKGQNDIAISIINFIDGKYQQKEKLSFINPIDLKDLKRVSSGFGKVNFPHRESSKFHNGVDFVANTGTTVYASENGEIIKSKLDGNNGNAISIKHKDNYQTNYHHLSVLSVKEGAIIKKGDKVGEVGSTGKSTGPHLHFEVLKNGKHINPNQVLHLDDSKVKVSTIKIKITKNTSDKELENAKSILKEKGVTVKFKGVKRNKQNEITAIKIDAEYKGNKSSYATKGDSPIITINITITDDDLLISPIKNKYTIGEVKINEVKWTADDSDPKSVIVIKSKDDKVVSEFKDVSEFIYSKTDSTSKYPVIIVEKDVNKKTIVVDGKKIDMSDIKTIEESEFPEIHINVEDVIGNVTNDFVYIDDGNSTQTRVIVNGKEISKEELKKMKKDAIKTIEIIKTDKVQSEVENEKLKKLKKIKIKKLSTTDRQIKVNGKKISIEELEKLKPGDIKTIEIIEKEK